jgi:elongation factor Tu
MTQQTPQLPFDQWPADFRASVRLLTAAEGGRSTPAHPGYRPQVYFETAPLQGTCTSGSWQKMEQEKLFPGETADIDIAVLGKEMCRQKLFPGLKIRLAEGSTTIGTGEILEVYNPDLLAGAR